MSESPFPARQWAVRFTWAHALLIAMSILAFQVIVDRAPPAWVDRELWTSAYAHGMTLTGPLYIITGFLAALASSVAVLGAAAGLRAALAVVLLSLGMELLGTSTGVPFGPYGYGAHLGVKVLELVPVVIPLSWFLMLYASLSLALRYRRGPVGTAVVAALGLLAWDVLMDPTMSAVFPFWSWHHGGIYYGMPLVNWFGWLVTGLLIAGAMQLVGGPRLDQLRYERLPVVIYALNGLFPLALALQHGMLGAALLGGTVMALFLAAAHAPGRMWRRETLAFRRT
jgi:carotene biosynthesis associated membrane protein